MDLIREKSELSAADQDMIVELQFKVKSLADENSMHVHEKKALTETLSV